MGVTAGPALAQGPVITGGLVNVTVTNVANNDTILSYNNVGVGVAANVAAAVCGVPVNVAVLGAIRNGGTFSTTCTIGDQVSQVDISQAQ
jgi:hypothetical protein